MGRREKEPFTRPRRRQVWGTVFAVIWSFAVVMLWGSYRHVYHASPSGVGTARHELGGFRWLLVLEDNVTLAGTAPPGGTVTRRWVLRPVPIALTVVITLATTAACIGGSRSLVARGRLRGRCDECGYDLSGLDGERCPECGWRSDQRSAISEQEETHGRPRPEPEGSDGPRAHEPGAP